MSKDREWLKGNASTLALAVLRDGPLHGYGIAREIERRSGQELTFKEGTLYPTLHSLEGEGLVVGEWSRDPKGRDRKVYTLTPEGLAALEAGSRQWNAFAAAVESILNGGPDALNPNTTSSFNRVRPEPSGG